MASMVTGVTTEGGRFPRQGSLSLEAKAARVRWALLGIIVAAGAWIRLRSADLVQFLFDQAVAAQMALDAVAQGKLPVLGIPSSLGIPNAPGFIWLLMPAALFTDDAVALTRHVALFGVAAVVLLWALSRMVASEAVGLAAAAFLACGVWSIQYSRSIWAQDCLPFLLAGCALALLAALERERPWLLALSMGLLALALQVHLSAAAFAAAWALALGLGMRRRLFPGLLAGAVLMAVLFYPYLAYLASSQWRDLHQAHGPVVFGVLRGAWYHSLTLLTARDFADYFLGADAAAFTSQVPVLATTVSALSWVVSGLILVGLARFVAVVRTCERSALPGPVLMLGWLLLPVLFVDLGGLPGYPHYAIVSLPAQAFFAAYGLLGPAPGRVPAIVGGVAAAAICVLHLAFYSAFLGYIAATPVHETGDFRATYRHLQRLAVTYVREKGDAAIADLQGRTWGMYMLLHDPEVRAEVALRSGGRDKR